jgi:hypothetical protein
MADDREKLSVFIDLVDRMMQAQRHYFDTRSTAALDQAKQLEKQVRAEIKAHKEPEQPTLFG